MNDSTLNNTTMNNTTMNTTGAWSGDTTLQPIVGTAEFPPLSQLSTAPGQTMQLDNPADIYVLEKQTPVPPGQENVKVQKDLKSLIPDSEEMIQSGIQRERHANAISGELKLLLENERKVLNHMIKRCDKFTQLKEENKRMAEEWYNEYKKRLPHYESNQFKLICYPDDHLNIEGLECQLQQDSYHENDSSTEGLEGKVQQKILFEIVSRTAEAANNILVQLSMENTIINDIDLSLAELRNHGTVMLKQICRWLKFLRTQDQHHMTVRERWGLIRQNLKALIEKGKNESDETMLGAEMTGKQIQALINGYEDRLQRLELAISQCWRPVSDSLPAESTNYC